MAGEDIKAWVRLSAIEAARLKPIQEAACFAAQDIVNKAREIPGLALQYASSYSIASDS